MNPKKKQTLQEGYEKFVIKNSKGCWDWKGCCPENPGYGQFRSAMKLFRSHIASWLIHKGEIPKGLCVCHTCDNKRCSNPDHLFLGTRKENNLDAISKNLCPTIGKKRDRNHMTKIFPQDFEKIVYLSFWGVSQLEISGLFSVSQSSIGKAFKDVRAVGY